MKVMVGLLLLAITYWIVVDGYRRLEEARGRIAWQRAVEAADCQTAITKAVALERKGRR